MILKTLPVWLKFTNLFMLWAGMGLLSAGGLYAAENPWLEITEIPTPPVGDLPVIPWIAEGDNSWQQGKPLFEIAHDKAELKAKGWVIEDTAKGARAKRL